VFFFLLNDLSPASSGLLAGAGAVILGAALDRPVEDVVILEALTNEKVAEELAEVRVIRLIVKAKRAGVIQENAELVGEAAAKDIGRSSHLLFHNPVIFLLLSSSLESLPREGAAQEVHEDVGKRLEVITTSLLNSQMGVD
jgi:hypothetical protein